MIAATNVLEEVNSVGFWFHSIDLGSGVITPGLNPHGELVKKFDSLRLPDLRGRTVLDIGAWDGFNSFEAEKRGAKRVVALDHFVWSMDQGEVMRRWKLRKELGIPYTPAEATDLWQPERLPGKRGFDTAHRALKSTVEAIVADFMGIEPSAIGQFDVVLYLGILYHMKDMMESLRRVALWTKELALIETEAVVFPEYEDRAYAEFFEEDELNADYLNWWAPNIKALAGMCRAVGFKRVEVLVGPPKKPEGVKAARHKAANILRGLGLKPRNIQRYRAIVQAWK